LLNRPAGAQPGSDAGDHRRSRYHDPSVPTLTVPHQVDRAAPIRSHSPRQPQFHRAFTEFIGRFRQMLRVYPEERVERLDLDVETFHQRNRHRPQIRKAAANRNLRYRVALRADRCKKLGELVDEPGRQIVAARQRVRGS